MAQKLTECTIRDEVAVVKLVSGRGIRTDMAEKLEEELSALLKESAGACKRMVINLETIEYMSSRALAVLVSVYQLLHDRGAELAVCRLRPEVSRAFQITRLEAIIPVHASEAEALGAAE